jgi:hypothetical protein
MSDGISDSEVDLDDLISSELSEDDEGNVIETTETVEETKVIAPEAFLNPDLPPMEGAIGEKICTVCKEQLLIKEVYFGTCLRCKMLYCIHYGSSVDPAYCNTCCQEVELTDQTITRIDIHKSEDGTKTYETKSRARQLIFTGADWLFYQRKISTLTDTELALAIEYHYALHGSMVMERDRRKIEYFHRNAGKQIRISTGEAIIQDSTSTTISSKRTTRTVKAKKSDIELKAILEQMLKSGMTPEAIAKMFK